MRARDLVVRIKEDLRSRRKIIDKYEHLGSTLGARDLHATDHLEGLLTTRPPFAVTVDRPLHGLRYRRPVVKAAGIFENSVGGKRFPLDQLVAEAQFGSDEFCIRRWRS